MSFDPEKVDRLKFIDGCAGSCDCGLEKMEFGRYVMASDYDQLLELYQGLAAWAAKQRDLPQGLWPRQRYEYEAARQQQGHHGLEPLTREISLGATQTAIGVPAQNGKAK